MRGHETRALREAREPRGFTWGRRLVLRRMFVCVLIFGGATAALTPVIGASAAVTLSQILAYPVNTRWRRRQLRRLHRELREAVEREEGDAR
jgi:hypothetical protein